MAIIELIPVLDLSTDIISSIEVNNRPKKIAENVNQYRLYDFAINDLEKIIRIHVSDIGVNDSCSLFGGYVLTINDQIKLHPQCCGLLEEVRDWKKILDKDSRPIYLSESHPSPKITICGQTLTIECQDENEVFFPQTDRYLSLNLEDVVSAVEKLLENLEIFSKKLDQNLSEKFNVNSVSEKLVWGK